MRNCEIERVCLFTCSASAAACSIALELSWQYEPLVTAKKPAAIVNPTSLSRVLTIHASHQYQTWSFCPYTHLLAGNLGGSRGFKPLQCLLDQGRRIGELCPLGLPDFLSFGLCFDDNGSSSPTAARREGSPAAKTGVKFPFAYVHWLSWEIFEN